MTAYENFAQGESRLWDISVALSFQDLVAHRVKKLVTILEDVQHKLLKLVVVLGLLQGQAKVQQEGGGHDNVETAKGIEKDTA